MTLSATSNLTLSSKKALIFLINFLFRLIMALISRDSLYVASICLLTLTQFLLFHFEFRFLINFQIIVTAPVSHVLTEENLVLS
jgi:hypothetical protein